MRKIALFLSLLALPFLGFSQHLEVGVFGGLSNYIGDVSHQNMYLPETHPAFGLFFRYNAGTYLAAKLSVSHGNISGQDTYSRDPDLKNRNLSFRSPVTEIALTGEINILGYQPYGLKKIFSPYVFFGIAGFHYDPQTKYDNRWIKLQPLGTEGQGFIQGRDGKYNMLNFAIPFGLGAKFAITDKVNVGLEFGLRKTFTDYLDDVSTSYISQTDIMASNLPEEKKELIIALSNRTGTNGEGQYVDFATGDDRGNPDNEDWYFFAGVTVSYNFMDNGLVGSRNKNRGKNNGCKGMRF